MEKKLYRFSRFEKLVGSEVLENIKNKTVLVLGCGGVGGYVVESLARSGVGTLILVDFDTIDVTNINRQIIALDSTVGRKKVEVFVERIADINKKCKVIAIDRFIDVNNLEELFSYKIDYFIDACDTVSTKKAVIDSCIRRKIPFISSMGTGNKLDPFKLEIMDIRKTSYDPLAKILRKYVKDMRIKERVMVLSSKEIPKKMNDRVVASTAFVPASAGLMIASYVINSFIEENKK